VESFTTGTMQSLWVHEKKDCRREYCPIHNPSERAKAIGITHYRFDRGIMERICEHGIGHPDPDGILDDGVHGCDGCCVTQSE
jgi:hypothetical protein